jgi:hypothetical protein
MQPLGTNKNKMGHHLNTPPLCETSRAQHCQAGRYSLEMENMADQAVIIDNGSGFIKAGFAGDDTPRVVFPSIVGKRLNPVSAGQNTYVGDEVQSKSSLLTISHPLENGIVANWDDMENIWSHTFHNELRIDPAAQPVMLIDSALDGHPDKSRINQASSLPVPPFLAPSSPYLSISSASLPFLLLPLEKDWSCGIEPHSAAPAETSVCLRSTASHRSCCAYERL